jgi:uncharacterized protein YuzE
MAKHDKKVKKLNKIISYDKENDILTIHKGFSTDEKFKTNIDVGNLILDVSTKGRIKGMEIMDATEFFKEFEIDKKTLESIEEAEFNATVKPNSIMIGLTMRTKSMKEMTAKIAVPLQN